ncbi:MAG: ABC transporter ATP-binding protein [Sandaracinaceae bacterium]|nr:ABC transporter ATP-binding protein [Sandaracinaceae bacterium]
MTDPLIQLDDVSVAFDGRVLFQNLSLRIDIAERVALTGASGVGKSTLLDLILEQRAPDAGRIVRSQALSRHGAVALVPQDAGASLMPWWPVHANIVLPLRIRGLREEERARALEDVRLRVDPDHRIDLNAHVSHLSGGEQQLVALMRALVVRPKLLICDEPFSAVDADTRRHLRSVLVRLTGPATDASLLLVSHDAHEVFELATRELALTGTPARLEPFPPRDLSTQTVYA